jgi:hypothetical protein
MGSGVPWAVAGLPDGGAAFSASQIVYEREGAGAPWQATTTPFPGGQQPGSLAPFREGGAMRVVASGTVPDTFHVESAPEAPPGFPPTLIAPYPLASSSEVGVLRQTAAGWSDEEHELNNAQEPEGNWTFYDEVYQPDPVSAVLVDASGGQGWAVGGFAESENHEGALDTADVDRYPADGVAPPGVGSSPVTTNPGMATFAIGGNAQCAAVCSARANARIGPDLWLASALEHANIPGVRAFFYTGPRLVSPHAINGPKESVDTINYGSELGRYAQIIGSTALPTYAAGTPTDLTEAGAQGAFEAAFSSFAQPFGTGPEHAGLTSVAPRAAPCGEAPGCQSAYYAMQSGGAGGNVRVIVIDTSSEVGAQQLSWLETQLAQARAVAVPAIVIGNADIGSELAGGNRPSAALVARALVQGGASAYFFDSPEQNVQVPLRWGGESIPTFGSGTLGYVKYQAESSGAFLGASGFLLAQVNVAEHLGNNRVRVTPRLIPNIAELAMEGRNGTLLRRSQAALFAGLARRTRAGNRSAGGGSPSPETSPYIPIPSNCVGSVCASGIFPEYSFTSSRPDIGTFVKPNLASAETNAVELGADGNPIADSASGLFCAYNAGTTIVTISAGGLSASLPVTVQAGSVRRPCGTTKLAEIPATASASPAPPPAPTPAPAPVSAAPLPITVPPPPASAPVAVPPVVRTAVVTPPPFFLAPAVGTPLLAIVPPPIPTPARPTPPSGTSPVTQPVEAPEKEEEEEGATESVSNQAVAYRPAEHEPSPAYLLGIVLLAALAGASTRRRGRRGDREMRLAHSTVNGARGQRQLSKLRDRRP